MDAKSQAWTVETDMSPTVAAGSDTWLAVGGQDRQWMSGGFAPAHLERIAQDTGKPIVSVTLDAAAVGTVDSATSDPKTAFSRIDQIMIGPQRIYAVWTQRVGQNIAQQRLIALDRCTLAVMASVDLARVQLDTNTQLTYDTSTNTVWLPSEKAINHYDATTLAMGTPGPGASGLPAPSGYARCLTAVGGTVWASIGRNGNSVSKIDAKTGSMTDAPALSLSPNDYTCVQHAGNQVYLVMDKQLVAANPDGTAGGAWPLPNARVAGVVNGETWVASGGDLHGLTSGASLAGPKSILLFDVTATSGNVWFTTFANQLWVYGS
jgi:hypothetical protein